AGNHPSVVFYSTSHNATGYVDDMNPEMIDGVHNPRDAWAAQNAERALHAEAIIRRLDPGRIVYHHHSGNLGSMHTVNFYANWTPIQEMSDWFGHWGTEGVKPLFTCEYSTPFLWDWSMYRGWYRGKREYGSAPVPWEFCLAEWNAQFDDGAAYDITPEEKQNLRWEAEQFGAGRIWHRWDYPHKLGAIVFDSRYPIIAAYISENWPAFRTWGVSANSPWEYGAYWRPRRGLRRARRELPVDWDSLQRPGLSPDYVHERYEQMNTAFEPPDWVPTPAADAVCRYNMPLLACIAGPRDAFTTRGHNVLPGEAFKKQLIVINNSRETVTAECRWSFGKDSGRATITLPTGEQERIPLSLTVPRTAAPGRRELTAAVRFSTGETQTDSFAVDVMAKPRAVRRTRRIALFDPRGETAALLRTMGVRCDAVEADADVSAYDLCIIGKNSLTPDGPAPDLAAVRSGLRAIIFEQAGEVLERRFGFRVAEYGMRRLFRRVPDSPLLAGLDGVHLRDWRGEATVLPPRLDLDVTETGHTVRWCDIPVTRAWRCGNRGNVASATIEKPACGDFLPVLDGGYALQYAALMEYREGAGMVLFCQTDVTGRTEGDPAAETLARNLIEYAAGWTPSPRRTVIYAGDPAGRAHLEACGLAPAAPDAELAADRVLVVAPGAARQLAGRAAAIAKWLRAGGHALAIGLDAREANAILRTKVATRRAEHIAACFEPFGADSPFAGVSPAEVHNRDPRRMPLVTKGAAVVGDGVLARVRSRNVVFCQLTPWQFDYSRERMNVKRTFRKASCLLARLLGNMGASGATRLLEHVSTPLGAGERRWLDGLYLDVPEEWDDPYRFFRW
ncbi:MAG: hypothetical protein GXY85_12395, partial [Candidatus Brocadiaceae bacterium]|nr:hypothetical protein [Candidatus Brocadiaceae bacterium]